MAQKVHESISTPLRWYQTKRLPLYFVVGGTFAGAAYFFYNNAQHPAVEMRPSVRQDPLSDEQPGAAAIGADHKESMGRQFSREHGFHKGQNTDGIFPNTAMAKQLGKIMGDEHASKS